MSSRVVLAVSLAACGNKPPPQLPVIGHEVPKTAPATCSDVGVILRGKVDGGDEAGRAREAAIANACEIDKWSVQVLDCVAVERKPDACLDKLNEKQHQSYQDKLTAWSEQYGGNGYGGSEYGNDGMDAPPEISCYDAAGAAVRFTAVPKLDPADERWEIDLRRHGIEQLCESDAWDESIRTCLGPSDDDNSACLQGLPLDQRNRVTAKLGDIDTEVAKVVDTKKKKKPDCKKVVAVHYADAEWKGKVDRLKGKERTKMIADSRTAMTKACSEEKWNDTTRACLVATAGDDCFVGTAGVFRWGFPAASVILPIGIAECDQWGAEVAKLVACDKVPKESRDAIAESYSQVSQAWANVGKDERATVAATCKSMVDVIKDARTSAGCP